MWNGCICAASIVLDNAVYVDAETTVLSPSNMLNARGKKADSMVYDAQGRTIYFPVDAGEGAIAIAAGKTLTLQNVRLVGFRPEYVDMQPSAVLYLGDNVVMSLDRDLDLRENITFSGKSVIDGNGKVLTFGEQAVVAVSSNSMLEIKDCVLKGVKTFTGSDGKAASSLVCGKSSSKLNLNSVRCFFDAGWTFSAGVMSITGDVSFTSTWATVSYTSGAVLTVNPYSSLSLERGITFSFASNAGQNKFVLADGTSALLIKNSVLSTGAIGMTLRTGALFLKGDVLFKNTTTNVTRGITLDSSLFTAILSGSTLSIDGIVAHGSPQA